MLAGTINLENFEEKRNDLAETVWGHMRARDSQECKNCHDPTQWNLDMQPLRAKLNHDPAKWIKEQKS